MGPPKTSIYILDPNSTFCEESPSADGDESDPLQELKKSNDVDDKVIATNYPSVNSDKTCAGPSNLNHMPAEGDIQHQNHPQLQASEVASVSAQLQASEATLSFSPSNVDVAAKNAHSKS